ncbi:Putative ribonuclease H protein At1g65750 [Linum perenne]
MRAELRGFVEGMKLAWDNDIRKLVIQTDSKAAAELLSTTVKRRNQHTRLLEQFFELASRDWVVKIFDIYRETNFAVDYLANLGQTLSVGCSHFLYS